MRFSRSISVRGALWAAVALLGGCTKSIPVSEVEADPSAPPAAAPVAIDAAEDWPFWRGPTLDGHAATGAEVPTEFGPDHNVLWKTPVPGRGHSSPTVVGGRVFLSTAREPEQVQSVLCFDRADGRLRWQVDVHRGGWPTSGLHAESTHASSTLACDGRRVYAVFYNNGGIWATALDLDGNQVWQQEVGKFASQFGYAPSPALFESLLIVAAEHNAGGYLAALDRDTGSVYWRKSLGRYFSYSSPVVLQAAGKTQLFLCGGRRVSAFDPRTGNTLWSTPGTAESDCSTMVALDDLVLASGGYPETDTVCVRADGSGKVVWRSDRHKAYVPSMLVADGAVYVPDGENGIMICLDGRSGQERWKARLQARFRASPVLAGGNIYQANTQGKVYVFKADPEAYELLAENRLGEEIYATPAICGGNIFVRVADSASGPRQEMLYCLGRRDPAAASTTQSPALETSRRAQ